jgi:ribosome modulation factor
MRKTLTCILLAALIIGVPAAATRWAVVSTHRLEDRIFQEGRAAGVDGIPVEACPYRYDESSAIPWRRGWIEGRREWLKR